MIILAIQFSFLYVTFDFGGYLTVLNFSMIEIRKKDSFLFPFIFFIFFYFRLSL
jgi:hypothetical protein